MTEKFLDQFIDSTAILVIRYLVVCGLSFSVFYILLKKIIIKHKLQSAYPLMKDHRREILYSISSLLIIALVFSLTMTLFLPHTKLYDQAGTYGYTYYWLSYFLMLAVHDTYFYWTHRLIHTKQLFKTIHSIHHKSTNPSPWTSYAFHPCEAFIQALVVPVIAFLFPVQKFALILYFLFQFFHNVYGHLGFELLPAFIRESKVGRQLNTSIIHNRHHKDVRGNYGLYFVVWDRLMETLKK